MGEHVTRVEQAALEGWLAAGPHQPVHKERDLQVRLRPGRMAHHQPAEQPTVHDVLDVLEMVMKRPAARRVVGDVEDVTPLLAWADRVAPAPVRGDDPERPRAVGVDAIVQPVQVESVRLCVGVVDVDPQPLVRLGVQDTARHAPIPSRLVHVRGNQRGRVRNRVVRVEVLPVDQGVESSALDLRLGDIGVLVAVIAHAIPAECAVLPFVRCNWAVGGHLFDTQVDVATAHSHRPHSTSANGSVEIPQL
jgi:hypothetical protein